MNVLRALAWFLVLFFSVDDSYEVNGRCCFWYCGRPHSWSLLGHHQVLMEKFHSGCRAHLRTPHRLHSPPKILAERNENAES